MILRPCLHCAHREGCPIKADILARARTAGLKLGTATFRCAERLKGFERGRRVSVTFRGLGHDQWGDERWYDLDPVAGTIFDHSNGRLRIWLDSPSSRGHLVVRVHPDFPGLKVLEESRPLCSECGRPEGGGLKNEPGNEWMCEICGTDPGAAL